MNNLCLFNSEEKCLEAKDSFVCPITETDLIHYMNKSNYEFVDLGLSVQWATCNIGAKEPWESGLYFAWGENNGYQVTTVEGTTIITNTDGTETTKKFLSDKSDYEHYNVETSTLTKYNADDGLTQLVTEDDGCYMTENAMRMPTSGEISELIENTTSEWIKDYNGSGVASCLLTSKNNGNSIFVPAVGFVFEGTLYNFGIYGSFWSSSLYSILERAFSFGCSSIGTYVGLSNRFNGLPLRAVRQ